MNKKTTIAAVAMLAMTGVTATAQTQVVVTKHSGEQQKFELADIGKFYFDESAMNVVTLPAKTVTALNLADLVCIKFVSKTDAIDNITGNDNQNIRFA